MKLKRIIPIIGLIIMVGLFLILTTQKSDSQTDNVDVRLKWIHQAQFAGYYSADQEGYYETNNIDVNLNQGGVDFPSIQIVAGGKEQFGVTGADQILLAREKGVPIVAIAAIYQKTPISYMSLKETNITEPKDFIGKTIGIKTGRDSEIQYRAMMKKLELSTDAINEIPIKVDLSLFFDKKIDIWPSYVINEPITVKNKGYDINLISPYDYGIQFYGDTLFTSEEMIKNNPDLVKRFVESTIKGWNYAYDNPQKAAKHTIVYSDRLDLDHEEKMMKASLDLLRKNNEQIGLMNKDTWQGMQKVFLEQGTMKKTIDIDEVFTNQFIPEEKINDTD